MLTVYPMGYLAGETEGGTNPFRISRSHNALRAVLRPLLRLREIPRFSFRYRTLNPIPIGVFRATPWGHPWRATRPTALHFLKVFLAYCCNGIHGSGATFTIALAVPTVYYGSCRAEQHGKDERP